MVLPAVVRRFWQRPLPTNAKPTSFPLRYDSDILEGYSEIPLAFFYPVLLRLDRKVKSICSIESIDCEFGWLFSL